MSTLYESMNDHFNHFPIKLYRHNLEGKYIWTPLHWHRSIELLVTFEGRQIVNVGSDNFDFKDDDWMIINSSELHSTRYNNISDYFRGVSILIALPFIETWIGKNIFFYNPHKPEITLRVKEIAEDIFNADETQSQHSLLIMSKIYELLAIIVKHCIKEETVYHIPFSKDQAKAAEFLEYIEQNYREPLSLKKTADYFQYNQSYFSRIFKEMIGVNYYDYVSFVRTHHAAMHLIETHATLTECALSNGFPNIKSFITMFKKQYGCTPGKFIDR